MEKTQQKQTFMVCVDHIRPFYVKDCSKRKAVSIVRSAQKELENNDGPWDVTVWDNQGIDVTQEFLNLVNFSKDFDVSQEKVCQVGGVREKPIEGKKCPSCGHFSMQPSIMIEENRQVPVLSCENKECKHWE